MKNLFSSNKVKHGTMATIFTVVFIALIIVLNVVVSTLTERFPSMNIDLTAEKLNTLSEDSVNTAKEVALPTNIYIIGSESAIRGDQIYTNYGLKYSQVANLADKMKEANPDKITVEFIDPDLNPTFVSQYPEDNLTSGTVLVKTDRRYKVLTVGDLFSVQQDQNTGAYKYFSKVDGALANAVYLANLETVPVVAVATGHEEMLETNARAGFDKLLADNAFEVKEFNLLTEEIPENAQLIFIGTPTTDYTKEEIAKISAFLNDETSTVSRSLMVTNHPTQGKLPNLASFLEEWGLKVGEGVVIESDAAKALSANPSYIYTSSTDSIFKDKSYSNLLAPYSSPIERTFDTNNSISTYSLIETSDTCYVSLDNKISENPETAKQTTAALSQKATSVDGKLVRSNVFLFGNTVSLLEDFIGGSTFGNRAYMTDVVKYATDTTDTNLGLTVGTTETNVLDITATAGVVTFVGLILFTVLVPLAILIAGFVVFLRRRHL